MGQPHHSNVSIEVSTVDVTQEIVFSFPTPIQVTLKKGDSTPYETLGRTWCTTRQIRETSRCWQWSEKPKRDAKNIILQSTTSSVNLMSIKFDHYSSS
jgi:hypothetical protein